MSSIMPILTTPSEILVFSSDLAAHAATDKDAAVAAITSHLFIVTSRVVDAFTLAILRITAHEARGQAKRRLPRQLASATGFHLRQSSRARWYRERRGGELLLPENLAEGA